MIVDDEPLMLQSFCRYTKNIQDLEIMGQFEDPLDAYQFIKKHGADVVFLDIEMPVMNGVELAKRLKQEYPKMLVAFVTAYNSYIKDANELGVEYYLLKPYSENSIEKMFENLRKLLPERTERSIYIQTFGRFCVLLNGKPIPLVGKTKEILALIVSRRGNEISNEELYITIWENRQYDNVHMKVYYNALKRLRTILEDAGISDLLISTSRGQLLNKEICSCDYFDWLNGIRSGRSAFYGEFMSEYSWGEPILALMEQDS